MDALIDRIVDYCVEKNIISPDQKAWMKYGLMRRVTSFIGLVVFFLLGIWLTDWLSTASFMIAFLAFRRWVNGYHAATWARCLVTSVIAEVAFLGGLLPLLGKNTAVVLTAVCFLVLLFAAPYNHPKMHYSPEELLALKHRIRLTVLVAAIATAVACYFQLYTVVKGFAAGFAMATFLLVVAYIDDERKKLCRK